MKGAGKRQKDLRGVEESKYTTQGDPGFRLLLTSCPLRRYY